MFAMACLKYFCKRSLKACCIKSWISSALWTWPPARRADNSWALGGGDREGFRESSSKKIYFAHHLDAVARPGSRELRAVKIPASYDAWRPPERQKNILGKIRFFGSRKSAFCLSSWISEELDNFRCQNQLPHEILLRMDLL